MKRFKFVLAVLAALTVALFLGGWQTQQNFGSGLPAGLSFGAPTFTISQAGSGNGALALAGNTSGSATFTAPATAGTATNPVLVSNSLSVASGDVYGFNTGGADTGMSRGAAGEVDIGNGTAADKSGTLKGATLTASTAVNSAAYQTASNCASTGGTCGSACDGSVGITNPATTVTVGTTCVTANSTIFIQEDATLGTKLTATCNSTTGRTYLVTTRNNGTSFIITASATPAANTACLNYWIVN